MASAGTHLPLRKTSRLSAVPAVSAQTSVVVLRVMLTALVLLIGMIALETTKQLMLPDGAVHAQGLTILLVTLVATLTAYLALRQYRRVIEQIMEVQSKVQEKNAELAETNAALQTAVAEREGASEAQRRANDQLQAVLNAVPGHVSWVSSDLKYLGLNQTLASTVALDSEAFVGQDVGFLDGKSAFADFLRGFFAGSEQTASREIEMRAGDAWRTHLVIAQKYLQGQAAVVVGIDVAEHKRAEQALRESEARYERIVANVPGMVYQFALHADGTTGFPYVSEGCREIYGLEPEQIQQTPSSIINIINPQDRLRFDALLEESARTLTPWRWEGRISPAPGQEKWVEGAARPERVPGGDILWDGLLMDITERKRSSEMVQRQLNRITALRDIDLAISSSLDLRLTLKVFLDQVTTQLDVDAACVLLLNPHTQTLEFAAGRGFHSPALQHTQLRLGESYAGRAALERRIVSIADLSRDSGDLSRAPLLTEEDFVAYYAVPIIAKGQVQGVVEIFHRAPLSPDTEWLDYLETLVGQSAVAIDNATLFEDLQRSNTELALAYDTTLEGWSGALDLRDKETEGHTRRVTELTMHLSRAAGMSEVELLHARRGALLHDIGKMGIPDSILLKPGPLSDEEWVVMRKHPIYAYELLSPISYLRPALDIPYCHHEKWDGSGYPRSLTGEQIPLCARIFAVVDVWDALRSDRPYRAGWPAERVREHIRAGSGTHFDPQMVEIFMKLDVENVVASTRPS